MRARERELGMLNWLISWLAHLIISAVDKSNESPGRRVGSHRALRGPHGRGGCPGHGCPASFSRLAVLRLCSCTSPGLLWIGLTRPSYPASPPLLPFLLPLSNYLLVSSPAGRSFFEKTTRARTRPTPLSQNFRSLPHPNRRYSSTFVCVFLSPFPRTRFPSTNAPSCSLVQFPTFIPRMCQIRFLFLSYLPQLAFLSAVVMIFYLSQPSQPRLVSYLSLIFFKIGPHPSRPC